MLFICIIPKKVVLLQRNAARNANKSLSVRSNNTSQNISFIVLASAQLKLLVQHENFVRVSSEMDRFHAQQKV